MKINFALCTRAFHYSFPVLLGYLAIGSAFGFLMANEGYPWWLTLVMSACMYAGAGQYIAVGLFAAGTSLWEAVLIQLVVNARHIAYGLSMMNRFKDSGPYKFYLIFGLTDETFALLSSLPENENSDQQLHLMFLVTLLNHGYWVAGSLIGAIAGSLLPFNAEGISYALTALFVVLMIEQFLRIRRWGIFIISAMLAILCVVFLPVRISLLAALVLSLAFSSIMAHFPRTKGSGE